MANRTRFAGIADALDYYYGGPLPGLPPPLVVISTPTTSPLTNPATLTLQTGRISLTDGSDFFPLNANCPLLVGTGQDQETMTPSSVSTGNGNTPSITGTFLATHGQGDNIASGTCGLQEAINDMIARGGGKVAISGAWARAGGTTAMKNAAVFNSPVTVDILDYRT